MCSGVIMVEIVSLVCELDFFYNIYSRVLQYVHVLYLFHLFLLDLHKKSNLLKKCLASK